MYECSHQGDREPLESSFSR